ncbi:hypothetical protein [uncultured Halopseudomonas sp.]|uniref:hypothetical protein n=1 Tax=uncultured Halopseudomonas sp. TaxID=2901193 RepID=UPI0030EB7348|tara:strand:+ start:15850 stop:16233 length:384 start_codon:yes stop_codon:yes gene_type:complete
MTDPNPNLDHPGGGESSEQFEHEPCMSDYNFKTSTETRPNGDLVLIVESPRFGIFRRAVPKDLQNPEEFVHRVKLDLLIQNGELPRGEILRAAQKDRIPTYTLGKLHRTRYASLWENRKIEKGKSEN